MTPDLKWYAILFLSFPLISHSQSAKDIVRKADEYARGKTIISNITIQTVRPNWTREITLKSWGKGNELAAILITAPVKDKGIVFLKKKKEIWNWIPSIERTIKMPPSMMSQSWMGTDFTNDDLVKEASIIEDYDHLKGKDTLIGNSDCYKIHLTPKLNAAVLWSGVEMCITKKNYITLQVKYFDEEGQLVNTLLASDIRSFGNRLLPARLEMIPADKKGQKTILIYNSIEFDKDISDSFFSTQNMTRIK